MPVVRPTRRDVFRGLNAGGFSLIELLVAVTLLSLVIASMMGLVMSIQRTFTGQRELIRAQESLRAAQNVVATILRSAGADPNSTGSATLEPDPQSHGRFDNLRTLSDFNPADGDFDDPLEDVLIELVGDTLFVRWQASTARQPLAAPVYDILFEYYATDGTLLTTESQIASGAVRAKFTIEAPRDPRDATTERIQAWWIYLRNRT